MKWKTLTQKIFHAARDLVRRMLTLMKPRFSGVLSGISGFFRANGYYVGLVALLVAFGIGAYWYRNAEKDPLNAARPANAPLDASLLSETPLASPRPIFTLPSPTPVPELRFIKPVSSEILAEYAPNALVWSDSLMQWQTHAGVDFAARTDEVVCAAEAGVVHEVYTDTLTGVTVVIAHENGYETLYAGLSREPLVTANDLVARGQAIGLAGDTALAEHALGVHLHFEMKKDGVPVEPAFES